MNRRKLIMLVVALTAVLAMPLSAQTLEKNKLNLTKEAPAGMGEVYSLGDSLFADANDINRSSRFILYKKADMEYRHNALYGKFDGQLIEDYAKFPGNFKDWDSQNIVYPKKAIKKRIQGVVSIACLIDPSGHAINPQFVNQPNELIAKEAMRLLGIMPAWKPAHFNERNGYMSCILDFWFQLPEIKK